MPKNTTYRDMLAQVQEILNAGERAEDFDADGITVEVLVSFGPIDVDSVDDETFWTIVERHDMGTQRRGDALTCGCSESMLCDSCELHRD